MLAAWLWAHHLCPHENISLTAGGMIIIFCTKRVLLNMIFPKSFIFCNLQMEIHSDFLETDN